jgi:hypothetical protein
MRSIVLAAIAALAVGACSQSSHALRRLLLMRARRQIDEIA